MATSNAICLKNDNSKHLVLKWTIKDVSKVCLLAYSTVFTDENCTKSNWKLCFQCSANRCLLEPCVDSSIYKFSYRYKVMVEQNKKKLFCGTYMRNSQDKPSSIKYFTNFTNFSNYIDGDDLQTTCFIELASDPVPIKPSPSSHLISNVIEKNDLQKLFQTGKYSDVILVAAGKEIPAYKTVLSLHSEVFAAMFLHKLMEENKSNRIVIEDFDHAIIEEMLHFMYTGTAPNINKMSLELLAVADKYALLNLKKLAISTLISNVNLDNAIKTLIYADLHGANELKAKCLEIMKANLSAIIQQNDWKNLHEDYPHLMLELLNLGLSK